MNVETKRTITAATVELDAAEAELLHEWMVRVLRLTDGGYSCPLREALCGTGRELSDHLGNVLGKGSGWADYPQTSAERLVSERRVWQDDQSEHEGAERCGQGWSFGGPPLGVAYCQRRRGHQGAHSATFVWGS